MTSVVYDFLIRINPLENTKALPPIVALVILWFRVRHLLSQWHTIQSLKRQTWRSELMREYYSAMKAQIVLTILGLYLAWSLLYFVAYFR